MLLFHQPNVRTLRQDFSRLNLFHVVKIALPINQQWRDRYYANKQMGFPR